MSENLPNTPRNLRVARKDAIESLGFALFLNDGELPVLNEAGQRVRQTRQQYNQANGIPEDGDIVLDNVEEIARRYAFQQIELGIWGNTIDITAIAWTCGLMVCVYRNKTLSEGTQFGPLGRKRVNILCKDNMHFVPLIDTY